MNQWRFVILAPPVNHTAPGRCYIAQDGTPTMMQSKAARFTTFASAKEFAEANHMTFNGQTYIGVEEFAV